MDSMIIVIVKTIKRILLIRIIFFLEIHIEDNHVRQVPT